MNILGFRRKKKEEVVAPSPSPSTYNGSKLFVPLHHYYSPFPDPAEVQKYRKKLFESIPASIPDIDLNLSGQIELLNKLSEFYKEVPFQDNKVEYLRYYFLNQAFGYGDAIILYSMIRYLEPQKYIEIGAGFSSCVVLDTCEIFLEKRIDLTFIDPFPEELKGLIRPDEALNILAQKLQDTDISIFKELHEGDMLFIDSSHVCKAGSDVQFIFFELLPILNKGVYIHFHDIFYPFEYRQDWIEEGRCWNESYILRAFLQNNHDYRIILFNNYIGKTQPDLVKEKMPLFMRNIGGSIYLQKL